MSMRPAKLFLTCVAGTIAFAGCSSESGSGVDARNMPAGYEAVDAAFGVRIGGLLHQAGKYTVPVVEFRTKGDYALYPVTTGCDGSFTRGVGTVFAQDGTIKEQIHAQGLQTVSASPQFAAMIDRVCADARASRFVADPFKPQEALALLFGEIDRKGEAGWLPEAADYLPEGPKRVSLRRSGEFTTPEGRWSYILTGSRDPDCEANACGGGVIGGALFRFDEGKWVLASHNPLVLQAGSFGQAVDSQGIRNLHKDGQPPLIRVDNMYCHMGYCDESSHLVAVVDGRIADVWWDSVHSDNISARACDEAGKCTDWDATIKLLPTRSGGLPDLEVSKRGREWDDDRQKLFELEETVVYRYDPAGKYHEVSRTGGPVEIPLPSRQPEFGPEPESLGTEPPVAATSSLAEGAATTAELRVPDVDASVDIASKSLNPPQYPPAAMRAGIEGRVYLVVDVDAAGRVTNVSVERSSRNRDLDRAAMQAARRWTFHPSIKDGKPAAGRIRTYVDFSLGG